MADDLTEGYIETRQAATRQNSALARLMRSQERDELDAPLDPAESIDPVQSRFGKVVDFGMNLLRPFGVLSETALAPIAAADDPLKIPRSFEEIYTQTGKAFSVAGKAAVDALFPAGQRPEIEKEVIKKFVPDFENINPAFQIGAELAVGILSDPAMLAFPFMSSIRKGLQVAAQEGSQSGPFRSALEEFVSIVPAKETEINQLKGMATRADTGDAESAKKLISTVSVKIDEAAATSDSLAEKQILKVLGSDEGPRFTSIPPRDLLDMPAGEIPDKLINLNLSKINTEDDVKELVTKLTGLNKERIEKARGTQTQATTIRKANIGQLTVEDLLGRRVSDFTTSEALESRRLLVSSAEQMKSFAIKASSPNAGKVDKVAFMKSLALHQAIREQVTGITAEAGRLLAQFNITAKSSKGKLKQIDDIISSLGNGTKIDEIANALADMDTPSQIDTFVKKAFKARTSDVILEAWINGLLSGPQTHVVNTLSNSLVAAWQVPERFVAAAYNKALGSSGVDGVTLGEATAQAFGLGHGLRDGLQAAFKTFGGDPGDLITKIEARHPRSISSEALELSGATGRAVDLLGKAVRVPTAALQIEDAFFKGVGYRMELNARAYRTAASEGLQGEDFARRVTAIIENPPEDIHLVAVDAARYQTFTNELDGIFKDYQSLVARNPIMKVVTPFVRTPTNIMKFAFERTPLAPLSKAFRADVKAGGARRELALARMSLGSSVMGMVSVMTAEQHITGGGPADPRIKSALYNTGWQPYSIRIGDKYFSYARLEPLGSLLGLAADFTDISGQIGKEDTEKVVAAIAMAAAKNVTSKTFLRGVSDMIKVLDDPVRFGDKYIQNLAGTIIPTGVAQIARVQDPVLRETRSILDKIKSRIPGYSKDLPPRRNIYAEPITLSGGWGPDIMSPIYTSEKKLDPASQEIVDNKVVVSMPSKEFQGVELNPVQYDRLVVLSAGPVFDGGPNLKEALTDLVTSADYQRFSVGAEGARSIAIRRTVIAYKQSGKAKLFQESLELQQAVNNKLEEKRKLLEVTQ